MAWPSNGARVLRRSLLVAIVVCGSAAGSAAGASTKKVKSEDAAAQSIMKKVLVQIASDYQVFGNYAIVTTVTLKNGDHALRRYDSFSASADGKKFTDFTASVRSASGTTFVVHGVKTALTYSCSPPDADCVDGKWSAAGTLTMPAVPKLSLAERKAVRSILMGSVAHYQQLFALGLAALGDKQYANGFSGLSALSQPGSHASEFSYYQTHYKPGEDSSSETAFSKADHYYVAANEPAAISDWRGDMTSASDDLGEWVTDAVSWQIREVSTKRLLADAAKFENDLASATTAAAKTTGLATKLPAL